MFLCSRLRARPVNFMLVMGFFLLGLTASAPLIFASELPSTDNLVVQIKRVKPSVVAVGTYYFRDSPTARFRATGFAVGDGSMIVTNAHTITAIEEEKRLDRLRIFHRTFPSHGTNVVLLEKDELHDLALLRMEGETLPPLRLGASNGVQEGEAVGFTGYPIGFVLGLNPTTHAGIISAIAPIVIPSPRADLIKKEIIQLLRQPYDVFQVDATAFPGNSGSPLFRIANGEVIGIINMVFVKGRKEHLLKEPTGITYAIPAKFVISLLNSYNR
jgi:S1-C subfamily serine protease